MREVGKWRGLVVAGVFGVIFLLQAACAQDQAPVDPSLQQAIDNFKKTIGEAQRYAYTEHKHDLTFDSVGKAKQDSSDTFEIIFLEGAPYQKHTLHNDRPLPEKEQKAEDAKLADVAKARHNAPGANDKKGLFNAYFRLSLPVDQIPTRFITASGGSEEIEGRRSLIFTATPSLAGTDVKQLAHDGLAYEMKLWVDQQDKTFCRIEAKVIADGMRFEKDSLLGYNWKKVNDEAWLPARYWFKGKVRYMMSNVPAETEQTYTDYKKFRVETKITSE